MTYSITGLLPSNNGQLIEVLYRDEFVPMVLRDEFAGSGTLTGHVPNQGGVTWQDSSGTTGNNVLSLTGDGTVNMVNPAIAENFVYLPGFIPTDRIYLHAEFNIGIDVPSGKIGFYIGNVAVEADVASAMLLLYPSGGSPEEIPIPIASAIELDMEFLPGSDIWKVTVNGVAQPDFDSNFVFPDAGPSALTLELRSLYLTTGTAEVGMLRVAQSPYEPI